MRSSGARCDPELAKDWRKAWKRTGETVGKEDWRGGEGVLRKSSNPHLAGGEKKYEHGPCIDDLDIEIVDFHSYVGLPDRNNMIRDENGIIMREYRDINGIYCLVTCHSLLVNMVIYSWFAPWKLWFSSAQTVSQHERRCCLKRKHFFYIYVSTLLQGICWVKTHRHIWK